MNQNPYTSPPQLENDEAKDVSSDNEIHENLIFTSTMVRMFSVVLAVWTVIVGVVWFLGDRQFHAEDWSWSRIFHIFQFSFPFAFGFVSYRSWIYASTLRELSNGRNLKTYAVSLAYFWISVIVLLLLFVTNFLFQIVLVNFVN